MRDGRIDVSLGDPQTGKSYEVIHVLVPERIGRGTFVIYASPNGDDCAKFPWGPTVTASQLFAAERTPQAVAMVDREAAIQVAMVAREYYETTVFVDEAHEVWPQGKAPSPVAVELFTRFRHAGPHIFPISQWPVRLDKNIIRAAEACGSVRWRRMVHPLNISYIEEHYGPEAALQVAELAGYDCVVVEAGKVPEAWKGHITRLRSKVERLRAGQPTPLAAPLDSPSPRAR